MLLGLDPFLHSLGPWSRLSSTELNLGLYGMPIEQIVQSRQGRRRRFPRQRQLWRCWIHSTEHYGRNFRICVEQEEEKVAPRFPNGVTWDQWWFTRANKSSFGGGVSIGRAMQSKTRDRIKRMTGSPAMVNKVNVSHLMWRDLQAINQSIVSDQVQPR